MPPSAEDRRIVERYFSAMQAGPSGEQEMVSLFGDDAEYIEPFSEQGRHTAHKGIAAIRQYFHETFHGPMAAKVKLTIDRLDVDGEQLRTEWTCEMPIVPAPFTGYDTYVIRDGKIQRLEINLSSPSLTYTGAL